MEDVVSRSGDKMRQCCVIKKKKIPLNVNGKFYKTVVRPATAYGTVCWALNEKEEINKKVAETGKVVRSVTRLYGIGNEYVMSRGG